MVIYVKYASELTRHLSKSPVNALRCNLDGDDLKSRLKRKEEAS